MKALRLWLWPLCLTLLPSLVAACGKSKGDDDKTTETPYSGAEGENTGGTVEVKTETGAAINNDVLNKLVAHFKFTSSMESEIINFIYYDFGTLASWNDTSRPSALNRLAKLYELSSVTSDTLSQWLMDRITYIFPDDGQALKFAFIVPQENRVYQLSVDTGSGDGVAASNIGGGLYSMYLDQQTQGVKGLLLNFNSSYIPFLSPRTGVMQIGPNFFDTTDSLDTTDTQRRGFRTIKSLYRLSVLFHEARHSDGNANAGTLSFAHLICPSDGSVGEEYEGLPACDDKANGAYNVGGQILTALEGVCDGVCSQQETSVLETIHLDIMSRLLVDDIDANYGDGSPEPLLTPIDTRSYEIIPE